VWNEAERSDDYTLEPGTWTGPRFATWITRNILVSVVWRFHAKCREPVCESFRLIA